MAKKKKRSRRRNGITIPVAMALPVVTVAADFADDVNQMGFREAARWLTGKMTGYYAQPNQPDWKIKHMKHAALPLAVGFMIHKVASRLGVNRALASAGVPFLRI